MNAYSKCMNAIDNATNSNTLNKTLRSILANCSDWEYPEDWEIKAIERQADYKCELLKNKS